MIYEEREFPLGDIKLILRSATEKDAEMLIDFLKTVTGETRFLMCESDEIKLTMEEELDFIREHNDTQDGVLIMGFLVEETNGEKKETYVGNCSFNRIANSRRNAHRGGIGIALFNKYTGLGIGRIMLTALLEEMKSQGYEQAELIVISNNDRARHLYESLGFVEYGRHPQANKYDDGTYADDILMYKQF